jgi:hypothetical protein
VGVYLELAMCTVVVFPTLETSSILSSASLAHRRCAVRVEYACVLGALAAEVLAFRVPADWCGGWLLLLVPRDARAEEWRVRCAPSRVLFMLASSVME